MAWVYLIGLAFVLLGRLRRRDRRRAKAVVLDTTLRVHLLAVPIFAFLVAAAHREMAPQFEPLLQAAALTIIVMSLDAFVVAPLFERSYAMFRSVIGTWLPFVAIFAAAWAAGVVAPG